MYKLLTIKDTVRVEPEKLEHDLETAIKKSLEERYEGVANKKLGIVLSVVKILDIEDGIIKPADPAIYYPTTFQALVFYPELHEVVEGEVIENTEFGSFVNIGPLDGLVHISQIMDDFVSFDKKNSTFVGKQTKKILKEGDKVRARIISISWGEQKRIGLTMRQPGLGSLQWIKDEKKKKKLQEKKGGKK